MATGRMIQRRISNNKDLPRLITLVDARLGAPHGAFAALVYTWSIAHLDVEGRMHGDPEVVKGTVVPRVSGITPELVRTYLEAMAEVGLVTFYEANGDLWLEFRGFKAAQPGLRPDREAKPTIPPPSDGVIVGGGTPAQLRSDSGSAPAEVKEEVEGKGKEDFSPPRAGARNGSWDAAVFLRLWERVTQKSGQTAPDNLRAAAEKIADAARVAGRDDVEAYAAELVGKLPKVIEWCRRSKYGEPSLSIITLCDDRHFARCEDAVAGRFDPDKPAEKDDGGRGRPRTDQPRAPQPPLVSTLRYGDD